MKFNANLYLLTFLSASSLLICSGARASGTKKESKLTEQHLSGDQAKDLFAKLTLALGRQDEVVVCENARLDLRILSNGIYHCGVVDRPDPDEKNYSCIFYTSGDKRSIVPSALPKEIAELCDGTAGIDIPQHTIAGFGPKIKILGPDVEPLIDIEIPGFKTDEEWEKLKIDVTGILTEENWLASLNQYLSSTEQ